MAASLNEKKYSNIQKEWVGFKDSQTVHAEVRAWVMLIARNS